MKRILVAITCAALAAGAFAITPTPYAELRQDHPQINDAIAAAPNSDLHGTFNRLSALYNRSPIDAAAPDSDATLPENFKRNLEATLADLKEDIGKSELADLTMEQKLDILQVVRIYGVARPLELWLDDPTTCTFGSCPTTDPECNSQVGCIDNDSAVINEIQNLVTVASNLTGIYTSVYDDLINTTDVPEPASLRASNFVDAIEQIVDNHYGDDAATYVIGVETIDY